MSVLRSRTYIEDLKYAVENTNIFDEFRNQSILITGATGLIGSGIVDVLLMANSIKNLNTRIYIAARNLDKALTLSCVKPCAAKLNESPVPWP